MLMKFNITHFADSQGRIYTESLSEEHRAEHGHYLTSPRIALFMAKRLAAQSSGKSVRVLDPAAGAGILAVAVCEQIAAAPEPPTDIHLVCYEIDQGLKTVLTEVLARLKAKLQDCGISLHIEVHFEDFILANAAVLQMGLFDETQRFDLVISNPPYFKVPKSDPRAVACYSVVHGQPNIYGFFMAICAQLLQPRGYLEFIVPRSFASGPYFRLFREHFFALMRPLSVHVFDSRRDAFARDEVLQENVIFHAVRDDGWLANGYQFTITTSHGLQDIESPEVFVVPVGEALDLCSKDKTLSIPATEEEVAVFKRLLHWTGSLHKYGLEISTGPVVPFRACEVIVNEPTDNTVPLLWMQNVKTMVTSWPVKTRKAQYLVSNQKSKAIVLPNKNYVLLRRFSAKEQERRLTAAPIISDDLSFPQVGLENHLNYVHRPGSELSVEEAFGLAALFNSSLIDNWFRAINGNTQVSATELRALPLPSIQAIREIGARAMNMQRFEEIDELVNEVTKEDEPEDAEQT